MATRGGVLHARVHVGCEAGTEDGSAEGETLVVLVYEGLLDWAEIWHAKDVVRDGAKRWFVGDVGCEARRRHEHKVVDVVSDVCDNHGLVSSIRQVTAIQDIGSPNCMPERSESCSEAICAVTLEDDEHR